MQALVFCFDRGVRGTAYCEWTYSATTLGDIGIFLVRCVLMDVQGFIEEERQ